MRKALLVIDMQKGSFTPLTPRHDTSGVINRINILADQFRKLSYPVIYIQHDGSTNNEFVPQTEDWDLLDELSIEPNDIFIDKYANDVFYQSILSKKLESLRIEELVITGCATDFCVASTVQSALTKDYTITVVKDAHTTGERPHLTAEQVIDHYNWVWQNMIPTKGRVQVFSHEEILNSIH